MGPVKPRPGMEALPEAQTSARKFVTCSRILWQRLNGA
jgi:hypothetical protein